MKIRGLSIRTKVLGMMTALIAVVIFAIAFVVITDQSDTLDNLLRKNAHSKMEDIRFYAARGILEKNDLGVADSLNNAVNLAGFVMGGIWFPDLSARRNIRFADDVTAAEQKDLEKLLNDRHRQMIRSALKSRYWKPSSIDVRSEPFKLSSGGRHLRIFLAPLFHPFVEKKPPLLAVIELVISDQVIRETVARNRNKILLGTVIFLFLGIVIALFFANYLVRPIRILADSAGRVGAGDLDVKVPALGSDELGMLAQQFNTMTEGLKQAQKAKEEQVVLNEQIRQATEIQEGMNPGTFLDRPEFQVKGFTRAAKGVGGDYYDFQILDDGRLALLISDVSGKSISASLVMVLIKTVFATYLTLSRNIRGDSIVSTINRVMCSQAHIDKFATFFFCIYNPETRQLDFTNGGHGPIFIFRKKGNAVTLTKLEGLPMGIDSDNEYKLAKIFLEPGDVIVLYTDGITEAWDHSKNEFGIARLRQKVLEYQGLNAREISENIVKDIDEFTGGAEQHDDMSLVIMKIPESVS